MTPPILAGVNAVELVLTLTIFAVVVIANVASAVRKNMQASAARRRRMGGDEEGGRETRAEKGARQIEDFLRSLTQQPKAQQREAAPAQPSRPQPAEPVRRPRPVAPRQTQMRAARKPAAETAARAYAQAEASTRRRRQAKPAPQPAEPVEAGMEDVRRTVEEAEEVPVAPAVTLEAKLPKDVLQRAVALREILGPCRAMQRYSSLRR